MLVRELDPDARDMLDKGRKLLVLPRLEKLANSVPGAFIPDFWCYSMFKKYDPPGTLGILCEPRHPALEHFPTDEHSDWQWWHLLKPSRPLVLDATPHDYRPIVQVIDNVMRQHKLGLIFQAKVGEGGVLVCAIDLLSQLDRPEASQLMRSIPAYMDSARFQPACEWRPEFLAKLLGDQPSARQDDVEANKDADNFG